MQCRGNLFALRPERERARKRRAGARRAPHPSGVHGTLRRPRVGCRRGEVGQNAAGCAAGPCAGRACAAPPHAGPLLAAACPSGAHVRAGLGAGTRRAVARSEVARPRAPRSSAHKHASILTRDAQRTPDVESSHHRTQHDSIDNNQYSSPGTWLLGALGEQFVATFRDAFAHQS